MSQVYTFYSYKGGVGRTMALANVSILLAKWGHRVLVVDWDLEAPGLEHFYKDYIDIEAVKTLPGVIDLLQFDTGVSWKDCLIETSTNFGEHAVPIHIISSGRRDEGYFKKVRDFNVDTFYEQDGGDVIESLRNEWLANYDYVLIDSRTGITEIGGICTIQLPDTVVMLFTSTDQGFEGVLDIMNRAGAAQQKLPYDRQKLTFLPIPTKFESNTEFKLAQEWLARFAFGLENTYKDWLPSQVSRRDFLELTKIPYIAYFSFGEKLPVIEQGVTDPTGLGYAYETLAAVIGNHLNNVDWLFQQRDDYLDLVNKFPSLENDFSSRYKSLKNLARIRKLKQVLGVNDRPIRITKNKESILACTENSVFPLFMEVSNQMKEIGSLFKNQNESLRIEGNYIPKDAVSFKKMTRSVVLPELIPKIKFLAKTYPTVNFKKISYEYTTSIFRNIEIQGALSVKFSVDFYDSVYEVSVLHFDMKFSRQYDEYFTSEDCENIANDISAQIISFIEERMSRV